MYRSFYNLSAKPFQISSDPKFLWMGEKHKEALATLRYGILDNKGFLLLTGDVGTGKTTLINTLLESLEDDIICTSVPDPSLSKLDFFNYIAMSFGIDRDFKSKGAFLVGFRKFLMDAYDDDKKVVLIIDEAQLLTQHILEEIRLLSNIERADTKLINIFFVGQNEFNEIVNQEQNRAVRQRLTLNYNIDPLTPDETAKYIRHRLKVAGTEEELFDEAALQEVFLYSGGFPRRINVLCDHALLSGYVNESRVITASMVKECAKELKIPAFIRNRDIDGFYEHQVPVGAGRSEASNVILRPREAEKKEKSISNYIMMAVGVLVFILICWWFLYPENFNQFRSNVYKRINSVFLPPPGKPLIDHPVKEPSVNTELEQDNTQTSNDQDTPEGYSEAAKKENVLPEKGFTESLEEPAGNLIKEKPIPPFISIDENSEVKLKERIPLPKAKLIVRFKHNTSEMTSEGFLKINSFSDALSVYPEVKIFVTGYTDANGNPVYNKKLSEFRANIVKSFLLGKGVMPDQVVAKGMGSLNPIEDNTTPWGRKMNRRVEIEIESRDNGSRG